MKSNYTITTLDKAPAMTRKAIPFGGIFDEAIAEALKLWKARPMSLPSIHSGTDTTYYYWTIRANGEWINRNTVPHQIGQATLASA